jgi:PadR family transcriptional regulator PadR
MPCYGTCMEAKFAALRRGMLEPIVLATLDGQSRYAGEIAVLLRDAGFPVQDGTLHPLLNRLRREGLLTHEWQESPSGPPRKYLSLSPEGRSQLDQFRAYLGSLATMLDSIGH